MVSVVDVNTERVIGQNIDRGTGDSSKAKLIAVISAVALGVIAMVGTCIALIMVSLLPLEFIGSVSIVVGTAIGTGAYFACRAIANKILNRTPPSPEIPQPEPKTTPPFSKIIPQPEPKITSPSPKIPPTELVSVPPTSDTASSGSSLDSLPPETKSAPPSPKIPPKESVSVPPTSDTTSSGSPLTKKDVTEIIMDLVEAKQYDEAEAILKRQTNIDPTYLREYVETARECSLALKLMENSDIDQALSMIKRLKKNHVRDKILVTAIEKLVCKNRFKEAIDLLDQMFFSRYERENAVSAFAKALLSNEIAASVPIVMQRHLLFNHLGQDEEVLIKKFIDQSINRCLKPLKENKSLTIDQIKGLAKLHGEKITRLNLLGFELNDGDLVELIGFCPRLKRLYISYSKIPSLPTMCVKALVMRFCEVLIVLPDLLPENLLALDFTHWKDYVDLSKLPIRLQEFYHFHGSFTKLPDFLPEGVSVRDIASRQELVGVPSVFPPRVKKLVGIG